MDGLAQMGLDDVSCNRARSRCWACVWVQKNLDGVQ